MRNFFFLIVTLSLIAGCNDENKIKHENEVRVFQNKLNNQFADSGASPLTSEDIKTFEELDFFPIDLDYRVEADFELIHNAPVFEMPTTTDRLPLYKKYGIASFKIKGKKLTLTLYQNQKLIKDEQYKTYLFLPFNDATNGDTTYGGGRYIDLEIPEEGSSTITIDFNQAYNPYCVYNYKYSCPIPPRENSLDVSIPAGVKAYEKH